MLTITRFSDDGKVTLGDATYGEFKCKTLELPWLQNQQNVSCIPTGIYKCRKIVSPSLGECFEVMDVPNRTYVRGHAANFTRQIRGCIVFGRTHADIDHDGIVDITRSKETLEELMALLPDEFMMEVA